MFCYQCEILPLTVWEISSGNYLSSSRYCIIIWDGDIHAFLTRLLWDQLREIQIVYCKWLYKINKLLCFDFLEPLCQPLLLLLPVRCGACLGQKLTVKRYVFSFSSFFFKTLHFLSNVVLKFTLGRKVEETSNNLVVSLLMNFIHQFFPTCY